MDETRFEGLLRVQATDASRRRVLGGLIGTAAGVLGGTGLVAAVKGGNGKSNKGGNGKSNKGGNGKGQKKGKTKVTLCHKSGTPEQQTIVVGEPASRAHLAHGDVPGACPPFV